MLKYFLLLIAAFAIALAVAPYLRREILKSYAFYKRRWQTLMKKWSLGLGRYFIRRYKRLELKEPQADATTVPGLGKLTPVRNASNIGLYETELSSKLEDPDVKNIAITGPYGSGKSSIIKTFFHLHPEYRPLYVSLAAFKDEHEQAITPELQKILDDRIEYSILQQLFYHVRGKDVPFSRLKRIRTVKPSRIVGLALLVSLFVICVLYVYMPAWLPGYKTWNVNVPVWLYYMAILGIVTGAISLIYLLFKFQQNASIIKLNLDKAQLEIAPDKGSSVLNQHMDEIVYYFGATSHDLLVIEDLDRFKNAEIFVKLREINTLINNSLQINRKVTFIYALRDDVFFDQNRTKFFDFILPVVPVTNASNSASNLINKFDSLGLAKPVSHHLLNDLSLFITDRRLIQNIFNEFQVYRYQLNNEALQTDMLLAMIVYKNIHPTDFTDLQSNKGMVYEFFQQKEKINAEMAEEMEAKLRELESEFHQIETSHLKSVYELKLLYVAGLFKAIYKENGSDFAGIIQVRNNYLNLAEITDDAGFYILKAEKNLQIMTRSGAPKKTSISFAYIETEVDSVESYDDRVKKLKGIKDTNVFQLKQEIKQVRDEIRQIRGQSVKELLARRKLSGFNTPINQHKPLAYLLNNGYISEEYWLYISYFEPGQLSKNDLDYILAVKNRTDTEPNDKLTNVGQVIMRLSDSDCLHPETLNYDLLNALLRLKNVYPGKLAAIVRQFNRLSDVDWIFIEGFRSTYEERGKELIAELIKIIPGFWAIIKKRFYDSELDQYLEAIIKYGDIESVVALNTDNILVHNIEKSSMIMEKDLDDFVEEATALIKRLNIKFKYPPMWSFIGNGGVLKYVYNNHHYAFNRGMIDFMINDRLEVSDVEKFNKGQLSNILASPGEPLAIYIRANLETYIKTVFFQLPDHSDEKQETFLFLLKPGNLSEITKTEIIEKISFKIEDIRKVDAAYHDLLLQHLRLKMKWDNLHEYRLRNKKKRTDEIIHLINSDAAIKELSIDDLDSYDGVLQLEYRVFLGDLLRYDILDTKSKITLLNSTKRTLAFTNFNSMAPSLMEALEERNLLMPEAHTLKALLKVNFAIFAKLIGKIIKNYQDPALLLKSFELELSTYQRLLKTFESEPDITNVLYQSADRIIMKGLLMTQHNVPAEILLNEQFKMSIDELNELAGNLPHIESVISLLVTNKELLTEDLIKKFIKPLPDYYHSVVANRQEKVVPQDDYMFAFLELLKEANILVKEYEVKNKEIAIVYLN